MLVPFDCQQYSKNIHQSTISMTDFDVDRNNELNGQLFNYKEYLNSTYSSYNALKNNFNDSKNKINLKVQEFLSEYTQESFDLYNSDFAKYYIETKKILSNILNSIENIKSFLIFEPNINSLLLFKPEIEIDDDGEISFEWYGRMGARANLTFGRNGELYFVSLFHGESQKARLFNNESAYNKINTELLRLYNDKIS